MLVRRLPLFFKSNFELSKATVHRAQNCFEKNNGNSWTDIFNKLYTSTSSLYETIKIFDVWKPPGPFRYSAPLTPSCTISNSSKFLLKQIQTRLFWAVVIFTTTLFLSKRNVTAVSNGLLFIICVTLALSGFPTLTINSKFNLSKIDRARKKRKQLFKKRYRLESSGCRSDVEPRNTWLQQQSYKFLCWFTVNIQGFCDKIALWKSALSPYCCFLTKRPNLRFSQQRLTTFLLSLVTSRQYCRV